MRSCSSVGTAHILGEIVPASASVHSSRPRLWSYGVNAAAGIVSVDVPAPFAYVAVHVVESELVRREAPDVDGLAAINAGLSGELVL